MATFNPGDKVKIDPAGLSDYGGKVGTVRSEDSDGFLVVFPDGKGLHFRGPDLIKMSAMSRSTIVRDRATGRVGRVVGMARTGGVVVRFATPGNPATDIKPGMRVENKKLGIRAEVIHNQWPWLHVKLDNGTEDDWFKSDLGSLGYY